ncbi:hypothetical protein RhiirA4_488726 [Rhizophagus irregularis]|uniref:Uncharacterized protein n=1 Tax=Rhizophagus irregularis TaxID=588596 RepID=A0A2I1HU48_9GLOM|nr:hypothetical protein RhiirA4_488726 [Rhizophagus irregularis]
MDDLDVTQDRARQTFTGLTFIDSCQTMETLNQKSSITLISRLGSLPNDLKHRGSVHVHGIGKKRNAPTIEWKDLKNNEEEMKNHPCQKDSSEIDDGLQDYIKLINKLQHHTRCSPSYCIRTNREEVQTCRFGYPKEHIGSTLIRDDKNGQSELLIARNDPYINPHNRIQLQR